MELPLGPRQARKSIPRIEFAAITRLPAFLNKNYCNSRFSGTSPAHLLPEFPSANVSRAALTVRECLMATAQAINDILQQAEALFHQGQFAAASQLLSDGIARVPSSKLWNDRAALQVSLGQFQEAEEPSVLGAGLPDAHCFSENGPARGCPIGGRFARSWSRRRLRYPPPC